ncbi:hypothetical protein QZH41_007707 [Actinostola sp. cb2023]|nr:hypothetical protein QZH41_007707 [Actinostola sp. cb2023]
MVFDPTTGKLTVQSKAETQRRQQQPGGADRQQQRLAFEKSILEDYLPSDHLRWIDPTAAEGEAEVEVDVLTNNDNEYSLRISIPNDFPNGCPSLIVSKPTTPLLKTNGEVVAQACN